MSSGFSYRGDLSETSLSEVFGIIERYGVPGVLEVTRAGMVKRVYVKEGYVVHASSSDPIDRLSEHVRRSGVVSEQRIDALDQERSNTSKRLGVLLIERDLMSPRRVYDAVCGQIEEIVWSLFAWTEGEVVFSAGELQREDAVQIKLPMRRVAFEGIKRAPDIEPMMRRLGGGGAILEATYRLEDLIDIGLSGNEMELLRRVDGERGVAELSSAGPLSELDSTRLLYAFVVLSLVEVAAEAPAEASDVSIPS